MSVQVINSVARLLKEGTPLVYRNNFSSIKGATELLGLVLGYRRNDSNLKEV